MRYPAITGAWPVKDLLLLIARSFALWHGLKYRALEFLCRRSRTFPSGRTGDGTHVPLQIWRSLLRAQARLEARPVSTRAHKPHNGSIYHFAIRVRSMPRASSSHLVKTRHYGFYSTARRTIRQSVRQLKRGADTPTGLWRTMAEIMGRVMTLPHYCYN